MCLSHIFTLPFDELIPLAYKVELLRKGKGKDKRQTFKGNLYIPKALFY